MNQLKILKYHTKLFINDCVEIITSTPWEYISRDGVRLWYQCSLISYTELQITFKDGQFIETANTQYIVDLYRKNGFTHITMSPTCQAASGQNQISESSIDCFMKDRIGASRLFLDKQPKYT